MEKEIKTLDIVGGRLESSEGGTLFRGIDGSTVFFQGVTFSTSLVPRNAAYQIGGTIHISVRWLNDGFAIHHFAHEYGHYLQQCDLGIWRYLYRIAIPSLFSVATDPSRHFDKSYEADATERGYRYMAQHFRANDISLY